MEVQTQIFAQNGVSWWSRHLQGACRFKEQKGGRPKVYPWLLFENTISRWGKKLSILTNSEKSTLAIKQTLLCLIENYELSFGPDSSSLKQNNLFVLEKEQICPIIISPRRITLTTKPPTKALRIVSTTITHTKTANLTNKYLFAGQTKALLYASRSRSRNSAQTYKIPPINPPPPKQWETGTGRRKRRNLSRLSRSHNNSGTQHFSDRRCDRSTNHPGASSREDATAKSGLK